MGAADPAASWSLGRLFGGETASFFRDTYERDWAHFFGRSASHFIDIFSLTKAEELLWRNEARFRDLVRFHRDGADIVQSSDIASLDQFVWSVDQFRQGTTIIFNTLEDCCPTIAEFVRDIEVHLTARVSAAAYITPVASQAFVEHFDTHDVVIAQIEGEKTYTLRTSQKVPLLPHRRQQIEIDSCSEVAPAAHVTLRPGDVLYIPRGILHAAKATDRHSLHLTFSLHPVRLGDLAATALEMAFEQSVELRRSADLSGRDSATVAFITALATTLGVDLDLTEVLVRQQQKAVARLRPLPGRRLTQGVAQTPLSDTDFVEKAPGAMLVIVRSGDELRIAFPGIGVIRDSDRTPTRLEVPAAVETAVRFIESTNGPFRVDAVPGPLSKESNILLLQFLVREGLLQRSKV